MEDVDIVFNNAASKKNICLTDPSKDLDINAGGTLKLLQSAKEHGVKKFIHASTGSVYGEPTVSPQTEEHPLNPVSYYGVSKLAGERYVMMYAKSNQLNATVLRYFHVYGTRQEDDDSLGGVVAIFMRRAKPALPLIIYGDGRQQRSFTHVDDIVNINRRVAEMISRKCCAEVYNCASGIKVSVNELAEMIIKITGSSSKIEYKDWLVGDIKKFDIDNKKVKELSIDFKVDIEKELAFQAKN